MTGGELNTATRSMTYNFISKYVVIFWDQGEASIIELDMPWLNNISMGKSGEDQDGRSWNVYKLSSPSSLCL